MVREKGILIFRVNTVCQVPWEDWSVTVALPGYLFIHFLHFFLHLHSNKYDTKQNLYGIK